MFSSSNVSPLQIGTIFYAEQFNIPWLTCTSIICNGETFEDENMKCLTNYSLHIDIGETFDFILIFKDSFKVVRSFAFGGV
jgi:hypothetical protein